MYVKIRSLCHPLSPSSYNRWRKVAIPALSRPTRSQPLWVDKHVKLDMDHGQREDHHNHHRKRHIFSRRHNMPVDYHHRKEAKKAANAMVRVWRSTALCSEYCCTVQLLCAVNLNDVKMIRIIITIIIIVQRAVPFYDEYCCTVQLCRMNIEYFVTWTPMLFTLQICTLHTLEYFTQILYCAVCRIMWSIWRFCSNRTDRCSAQ